MIQPLTGFHSVLLFWYSTLCFFFKKLASISIRRFVKFFDFWFLWIYAFQNVLNVTKLFLEKVCQSICMQLKYCIYASLRTKAWNFMKFYISLHLNINWCWLDFDAFQIRIVKELFIKICDYIVHKLPLKDEFLIYTEVCNVKNIEQATFSSIQYFLDIFPIFLKEKNIISEIEAFQTAFTNLQLQ